MTAMITNHGQPDLDELRTRLLETRASLLAARNERMRDVRHSAAADAGDDIDTERPTAAFLEAGLTVGLAEIDQQSKELDAIARALAAMDEGTYGMCLTCGVSIDGRRLFVNPATLHCLRCEADVERRAARAG